MTSPCIIDTYPLDRPVDWPVFLADPRFIGGIFKLTEGLDYQYSAWAKVQRDHLLASPRYGIDLFDGFYTYLKYDQDGAEQVDRFWSHLAQIGGERAGTLPAMLDAERGGQRVSLTKTLVEHVNGAAAARYYQLSGRLATLYIGELARSLGIKDRMGCGRSAVALYASELRGGLGSTAEWLAQIGTDLEHTMLWQYVAAEGAPTGPVGYPREAPGIGRVDISALVLPGGLDALRTTLTVRVS